VVDLDHSLRAAAASREKSKPAVRAEQRPASPWKVPQLAQLASAEAVAAKQQRLRSQRRWAPQVTWQCGQSCLWGSRRWYPSLETSLRRVLGGLAADAARRGCHLHQPIFHPWLVRCCLRASHPRSGKRWRGGKRGDTAPMAGQPPWPFGAEALANVHLRLQMVSAVEARMEAASVAAPCAFA